MGLSILAALAIFAVPGMGEMVRYCFNNRHYFEIFNDLNLKPALCEQEH
jgi:hypothetical protein